MHILSYMSKFTRILFHLAALCDSLRCGAYGTYCYGISCFLFFKKINKPSPPCKSSAERVHSAMLRFSPGRVSNSSPEQGIKLLGLLLTGSTGQHMASRNGLA